MSRPSDEHLYDADVNFFDDPTTDRLIDAFLALASEHWVTRRRLALMEKALEKLGVFEDGLLEMSETDLSDTADRDRYVANVVGALVNAPK